LVSPYKNTYSGSNIPFINAQGDMADKINYQNPSLQGTSLQDLKSEEIGSEDSLFDEDSLSFSEGTTRSDQFTSDTFSLNSSDINSLQTISDDNNSLFDNKYVSKDLEQKLKNSEDEIKKLKDQINNKKNASSEVSNFAENIKSDIKEITIVIVIGLIIIFLLDLFYKIGKKLS
jgi:NAD+--asparagine ADP-ribosyltransferase